MVQDGHAAGRPAHRVHPLPQLVLPADPAARPAVQPLPAGPGGDRQAQRAALDAPDGRGGGRRRGRCRRSRATSSSSACRSGTTPRVPVLRDVDLHIRAGETISFVGPTGAGKSTIAKLVTRFYDPTEGSVRIDGHDLRDVTIESLRRQLGVVPQEPFLFAGHRARQHRVRAARRDRRRGDGSRAPRRARPSSSRTCPKASTRRSTSAACRCRRASASSSRWPARSSPGRASSCSTRRRRTSTSSRRRRSRPASTRCSRAGPRSSSPTGCRPRCAPTGSRSSTTAGSPSSARTRSSSPGAGATPTMYAAWIEHLGDPDEPGALDAHA